MKRIIFILALTVGGILASLLIDAYYGVLLYTFYSFTSPVDVTYGGLAGLRLSFIVAGVVIMSASIHRQNMFPKCSITFLVVLFVFYLTFPARLAATASGCTPIG